MRHPGPAFSVVAVLDRDFLPRTSARPWHHGLTVTRHGARYVPIKNVLVIA